ncbi:hypothetical protein BC628DRAFT_1415773 [Trametes gibbosa]|nr:hypothetical protein BC628DRAFT_1415773 [Trametes gibbosa]
MPTSKKALLGGKSLFNKLPLKITFEILSCVEPEDIVNFCHADTEWRDKLMQPNATYVWNAARRNVEGLPDCPPYMDEAAYAHLLYSSNCHGCGQANVQEILFVWGVRYCKKCRSAKTKNIDAAAHFLRTIAQATQVYAPFSTISEDLHVPEVYDLWNKWYELEGDDIGRKALAERCARGVVLREEKHAKLVDKWDLAKRRERCQILKTRLEVLKSRVRNLSCVRGLSNWEAEFSKQPFATKCRPLTDCEWLEIRDEVIEYFKRRPVQDLVSCAPDWFCYEIYPRWARKWNRSTSDIHKLRAFRRMRPADFLLIDCIKSAVTQTGISSVVVEGYCSLLQDDLEDIVEDWYTARRGELNSMLRKAVRNLPATAEPVNLAICMFDCTNPHCKKLFMHYPDVLGHRCAWDTSKWLPKRGAEYKFAVQRYIAQTGNMCLAWDKDHVRVSPLARTSRAREIVLAYGFDPDRNIQRIIYDFSVRYCRRCKKDMLVKIDDTMYSFFENVENTTDMHEEFLTTTRLMNRDDFEYTYLHAPEWSDFQQVWGTLTDTEAVIGYIQERIAFVKSIKQWSEVLYTWKTAQVMDRADELRQLRTERLQTLLAYLRQEGWEEELELISIDDYVRLTETPFARRASKLTARSWFTIREDAHAFMSDVQTTRLLNRRRRVLYCRFNILSDLIDDFYRVRGAVRQPEWDINPGIVDLALSPGLRAILDAPGDSPPANLANITDLAQVVATIGWAMHNWSEAVKAELVKQVRTVVQDLGEVPDPLSLALAIFSCRTCHGAPRIPPLCFPQLLAHPCLRRLNGVTSPDTSIYVATAYEYCNPGCGPLTLDRLTVDPGMVQRLRSVIQAMGLDPLRATRAELDSSGVRMTCSTCFAQRPGDMSGFLCEAFDWMRAVSLLQR